jgi:hypothetical protein
VSTESLQELIAVRAYEIFQKRDRAGTPGNSDSDWAQAEKEVKEELKKKDAGKAKAPESKPAAAVKPEVKEPPKPVVPAKVEEKTPPKAEPKAEAKQPAVAAVSPVKTVVAKKAVKK